jgi:hypothetical protein
MKGMLIIGKPTGQPDNKGGEEGGIYSGGDSESDMSGMAERRAAKDILAAHDKGDPSALAKGLKAFAEACGWGSDAEEADETD